MFCTKNKNREERGHSPSTKGRIVGPPSPKNKVLLSKCIVKIPAKETSKSPLDQVFACICSFHLYLYSVLYDIVHSITMQAKEQAEISPYIGAGFPSGTFSTLCTRSIIKISPIIIIVIPA